MDTRLLDQARKLPLDQQLELVEALWDAIAEGGATPLTEEQKAELDRRLADLDANPEDVLPWSDVKASALARIGR